MPLYSKALGDNKITLRRALSARPMYQRALYEVEFKNILELEMVFFSYVGRCLWQLNRRSGGCLKMDLSRSTKIKSIDSRANNLVQNNFILGFLLM